MTVMLWPRLPHGEGETPLSYASRLASLHARTLRQFCSDLGIPFQQLVDGRRETIFRLSRLGGTAPESLFESAMVRTGLRQYTWRGEDMGVNNLARLQLRACPLCLAEDYRNASGGTGPGPHGRTTWLLRYLRVCPRHQVMLVDLPSSYETRHDFAGTVGPILPELLRPGFPVVERASSEFEGYLLRRLDGAPDPGTPWLNGLGFAAAADACEVMGAVIGFGRRHNLTTLDGAAWHVAGELGFLVARQGPPGIREMLAAWEAGDNDDRAPGDQPLNTYGTFRTFLFNPRHMRADLEPLREVVVDHVTRTTPVGPGDVVHGRVVKERLVHSLSTASKETGVSTKTLRKILREAGAIDEASDRRVATAVLFDAVRFRPLLEGATDCVTTQKVGAYLHASSRQVRLLVSEGLIPTLLSGTDPRGVRTRTFSRSALDEFLRRLTAGAVVMRHRKPGTCSITRAATRSGCASTQIVRLLLAGAFQWVGLRDGAGDFNAIRVRVAEVKRLTATDESDTLTPLEVSKAIGITYERVLLLIGAGLIVARRVSSSQSRHSRWLVERGEVSRFGATYVTLGDVGRDWRLHPNRCRKILADRGVRPVFSASEPHISVYLRTDVTRD